MGGGRCAWEEGSAHGRRAAHIGGGRCAWEEGGAHGRRVACMRGGRRTWEEGGARRWDDKKRTAATLLRLKAPCLILRGGMSNGGMPPYVGYP